MLLSLLIWTSPRLPHNPRCVIGADTFTMSPLVDVLPSRPNAVGLRSPAPNKDFRDVGKSSTEWEYVEVDVSGLRSEPAATSAPALPASAGQQRITKLYELALLNGWTLLDLAGVGRDGQPHGGGGRSPSTHLSLAEMALTNKPSSTGKQYPWLEADWIAPWPNWTPVETAPLSVHALFGMALRNGWSNDDVGAPLLPGEEKRGTPGAPEHAEQIGRRARSGLSLREMADCSPPPGWSDVADRVWPWEVVGWKPPSGWTPSELARKTMGEDAATSRLLDVDEEQELPPASAVPAVDIRPTPKAAADDAWVERVKLVRPDNTAAFIAIIRKVLLPGVNPFTAEARINGQLGKVELQRFKKAEFRTIFQE